jgi:pimeloyl-ACP methyl ester carboxylesterase
MVRNRTASLAGESLAVAEFAQLFSDPVYYGIGAARGDGRHVVVLPGLFGNDWYLYPLRSWLARIGFRPVRSSLAINAGCPERLTRQVEREIANRLEARPGPVALIGHSRGGILARAIAARLQDQASHLILLGSPVGAIERSTGWPNAAGGNPAHESVAQASNRARSLLDPDCDVPQCGCPFPEDLRRPLSEKTALVSIYSANDPVVPAWSCPIPGARNVEVSGTHTGLVCNGAVYRELAAVLT